MKDHSRIYASFINNFVILTFMLQINRKECDAIAVESQENTERESLESSGQCSTAEESGVQLFDSDTRKIQESQDNSATSEEDDPLQRGSVGCKDLATSQTTAFVRFKKNSLNKLNSQGSYRPLFRHRGLANGHKFFTNQEYNMSQTSMKFEGKKLEFKESTISESQELEDSMENGCHEDELGGRDLYKDYQHNPVLECVNQILLRDQEETETTTSYQQESICKPNSKGTGRFNYHCHSIKEEGDEESFTEGGEEEIRSHAVESHSDHHTNNHSNNNKENCEQENKEPIKLSVKDKTPSPPVKAQLLEEKACLLMASQRLTLVRNLEFEDLDKKGTTNVSSCPSHMKAELISGRSQVPPALPPKPPQLGAKGLYKKRIDARLNQNHSQGITTLSSASQDQESCLEYRPNQSECVSKNQRDIPECKNVTEHSVNCNHHDTQMPLTSHMLEKPRQRQILSNGSLKLALNQDLSQQTLNNSYNHLQEKNNNCCITSPGFKEKLDNLNISDFQNHSNILRHQVRGGGSVTIVKNDNQSDGHLANHHNHEPRRHKALIHSHTSPLKSNMETPPAVSKNSNHCNKIRVGSSVSSLITGSSGNSIVNELTKGEPEETLVLPRVSQMVRRFEDLGTGTGRELSQDDGDDNEEDEGNNTLRCNFEEFKLEDVDMDSVGSGDDGGRPAGDGAEARAAMVQNGNSSGSYEHFLEATGLSQKSILTPSRLYSNHRNVMKPRDVKHRNKVLKAAAVNGRSVGPVVKYWVEPFL
jgi:curved DNA-binding protein CbpA